ncbi:MAG: hypothetical protein VX026_08580 [Myxococcota bacterium]|nr:hypothetical protein [Myxococcota bacterium]
MFKIAKQKIENYPEEKQLVLCIGDPKDYSLEQLEQWENDNQTIEIKQNQNEFYSIGFATANVLFALDTLAKRYSGKLLDLSKQPLNPYYLDNETNFARVYIQVPLQHWNATDESLRHLGSVSRHPMVMFDDEHVIFTIEVTFNP